MTHDTLTAASTSWPDAAVAIAGIALVAGVVIVAIWQALTTWRTRIAVAREERYRELAERTARDLAEITDRLAAGERTRAEEHDEHVHQH
jgi:hypothetical protein